MTGFATLEGIARLLQFAAIMKKPKQLHLFKTDLRFFGGRLLHGKRRTARPLSSKEPLHIVMRSSWAHGAHSFLRPRNKNEIQRLIIITAKKYEITVYQRALAGNHLHLVVRAPHRRNYKTFVRVLSSRIASHVMHNQSFQVFRRYVLRQEPGDPSSQSHQAITEPQGLEQQFWQFRPWSRVLSWGRDYRTCCAYVVQNTLEALGFIEYRPRNNSYAKWTREVFPPESS